MLHSTLSLKAEHSDQRQPWWRAYALPHRRFSSSSASCQCTVATAEAPHPRKTRRDRTGRWRRPFGGQRNTFRVMLSVTTHRRSQFCWVACTREASLRFLLHDGDSCTLGDWSPATTFVSCDLIRIAGGGLGWGFSRMDSYLFSRNVSDLPSIHARRPRMYRSGAAGSACALWGLDQRCPVTFS